MADADMQDLLPCQQFVVPSEKGIELQENSQIMFGLDEKIDIKEEILAALQPICSKLARDAFFPVGADDDHFIRIFCLQNLRRKDFITCYGFPPFAWVVIYHPEYSACLADVRQ
ncbi:MAG: hypothetical protein ACOY32_01995 [Thermodesulfobacteriota bacterium]